MHTPTNLYISAFNRYAASLDAKPLSVASLVLVTVNR